MAPMIGWGQRSIAWRKSTRFRLSRKRTGTCGSTNSRVSAPAGEARRRARIARRRLREDERLADHAEASDFGVVVLVHQVVVAHGRVLEEVEQRLYRCRRDVVGGQDLEPLGAGLLAEPRLENRQKILV